MRQIGASMPIAGARFTLSPVWGTCSVRRPGTGILLPWRSLAWTIPFDIGVGVLHRPPAAIMIG